MPHRCTKCGTLFEDGNAVILNGCPNCGWNKFLYERKGYTASISKVRPALKEKALKEKSSDPYSPMDEVVKNIDEALASEESSLENGREDVSGKGSSVTLEEEERVESVRILGPGSYELNLNSLFERDELVMALKEEGSYALHLPSVFKVQKENGKGKGKPKDNSKESK
ncbi:MAG: Zn-ribbon domain-containing protein [Methanosarcinaceae archaeon]|nr:Zn-ribbon domain-containing protein [Methanosarcinaceae archaeon]